MEQHRPDGQMAQTGAQDSTGYKVGPSPLLPAAGVQRDSCAMDSLGALAVAGSAKMAFPMCTHGALAAALP